MSVLLAQAMSHLMSHLPGLSQQALATQGSRTVVLPMEAVPEKHREVLRIVLIHTGLTGQERLSYSIEQDFAKRVLQLLWRWTTSGRA